MNENTNSVYPELTTIKVVYQGRARRVKIPYDMGWPGFEKKICKLFNISPPLVTSYQDDMGVAVIVDNSDDFYFFLDEEFNGRLDILSNNDTEGVEWTVVRNEERPMETSDQVEQNVNDQTLSTIPSVAESSPAQSVRKYISPAVETVENFNENLNNLSTPNHEDNSLPNEIITVESVDYPQLATTVDKEIITLPALSSPSEGDNSINDKLSNESISNNENKDMVNEDGNQLQLMNKITEEINQNIPFCPAIKSIENNNVIDSSYSQGINNSTNDNLISNVSVDNIKKINTSTPLSPIESQDNPSQEEANIKPVNSKSVDNEEVYFPDFDLQTGIDKATSFIGQVIEEFNNAIEESSNILQTSDFDETSNNQVNNIKPVNVENKDKKAVLQDGESILFETTFPETNDPNIAFIQQNSKDGNKSTQREVTATTSPNARSVCSLPQLTNNVSDELRNPSKLFCSTNVSPDIELLESASTNSKYNSVLVEDEPLNNEVSNQNIQSISGEAVIKSIETSTPKEEEIQSNKEAEPICSPLNTNNEEQVNNESITCKVQRLRNICQSTGNKLEHIPASLLITELFSDQIFNGVNIDINLLEQAINRISNGDKSKQPPISADRAASEVFRNMKTLLVHLGASMSDFVEQDLIPFIKKNVDTEKWMINNHHYNEQNENQTNNETNNEATVEENVKGSNSEGSESSSQNQGSSCDTRRANRFGYLRYLGVPTPFLRAKHNRNGLYKRRDYEYTQSSSNYGCRSRQSNYESPNEVESDNESNQPITSCIDINAGKFQHFEAEGTLKDVLNKHDNTGGEHDTQPSSRSQVQSENQQESKEVVEDSNKESISIASPTSEKVNERLTNLEEPNSTESIYNHLYPMKELFKLPLSIMHHVNENVSSSIQKEMNTFQDSLFGENHWDNNNEGLPSAFKQRDSTPDTPINPFSDEFAIRPPKPMEYQNENNNSVENIDLFDIVENETDQVSHHDYLVNEPVHNDNSVHRHDYINEANNNQNENIVHRHDSINEINNNQNDLGADIEPADIQLIFGLNSLREMGFPNDINNLEALQNNNMVIEDAIEYLLARMN